MEAIFNAKRSGNVYLKLHIAIVSSTNFGQINNHSSKIKKLKKIVNSYPLHVLTFAYFDFPIPKTPFLLPKKDLVYSVTRCLF